MKNLTIASPGPASAAAFLQPDRPPQDQLLPDQLLHYQLRCRLGQGGYGDVYEAWDSQLQRKVAIKRLKALAKLRHPNSLLREARLAASLRHPAFVQIFAIEEDEGGHAIVMELVQGTTWRELADAGQPALPQILDMIEQLAEAMQAAHASGLVHGDLKPSNLMREPSGKVRILDLGLAFHDDAQATTSLIELEQQGTIAYMAPECLLGAAPNRQSDIYAAGVILYELLTGTRPFGALAGLALAAAQMQSSSAQWVFPETVPHELAELVRAMTARRPEQRLAGMREVVLGLKTCVRRGAGHDAPAMARTRRLWRARRRTLVAAPLLLLLALGAWQMRARYPSWTLVEPVFSRSVTIERALRALRQPDRPERLDAADADFRAVLEHDADNAAAVAGLSLLYSFRYAGDSQDETWLQRAAAGAQQALKLNGQLALAHVAQAWVLSRQGSREAALAACARALELDPGNFFAALGKATFLTQLRRFDEAQAWLAQAQVRHPGERLFSDALGTVYYEQGAYTAAEQAFRTSIKLEPDSVYGYANLNATLLRENRRDEALGVLQQGLQIRPSAPLYANLGNALFARGDYVGAAAAFGHAVTPPAGNPNSYLGWANLADTLRWIPGRATQARDAYGKARQLLEARLQRTPNDVTMMSRMSLYSARVGAGAASIALLRRALLAAPASPDVHFRAGLAYELLGERKLALEEISTAKSRGYPASAIEAEPDLVALRRDTHYQPQQFNGVP